MLSFSLLALATSVAAVAPQVELDYATYIGTANADDGISRWLGMRYAACPIGDLRFAAPQPPVKETCPVEANTHGPICIGTGSGPPTDTMNEDCLFLDVYAPTNATSESKLPVYFFIQGGGFNTNSNPNYDGRGWIQAAEYDMVVVTFNYRVGPWGFVAGQDFVEQGGSVNNGLKDQRMALEWVQKYIENFGGDPKQVTMGGDSAGAQSVTLQLTAYGGRDDGLFQAVSSESQSFPPLNTIAQSDFEYKGLAIRANCSVANSLACLRNLSAADLQAVNINQPFPGAAEPPLYMYGPTLDFDFVTDYTYRAYAEGKFVKVPAIYGDDTNEGTVFVPVNTSSYAESNRFMQNNFPNLTLSQLGRLNELYPITDYPSLFPDKGTFFRQVAQVYGEMRYICPGIYISQVYANMSVPNYNYHWNVIDPDNLSYGVTHTVEINAIWGPENTNGNSPASYYPGGVNANIVPVAQGYWTSFVRSVGNPNQFRSEGTPEWVEFAKGNGYDRRLRFETNATQMESIDQGQLERCEYLWSIALALGQ